MTNQLIYNTAAGNRFFDWKTFYASSMFFLVVLISPRDFPINNLPLIYPAFVLFVLILGPNKAIQGFLKTKALCFLIIAYWFYYRMLILVKVGYFELGYLAYLLEPIMIFVAAGMATIRPGGAKAALWALVSMIIVSTACGIWIYFIGEPLSSFRTMLHSTIGGNILSDEFIREVDLRADITTIVARNTGLSFYIFSFSYQLAVAISVVITYFFLTRRIFNKKTLPLWGSIIILLVGIITNTERATVLSVFFGLASFFSIKWRIVVKWRTVIACLIGFILIVSVLNYFSNKEEHYTLSQRFTDSRELYIRGVVVPTAAVASVLFEPFGARGMSENYRKTANSVGWVTSFGEPKSGHNHFVNVIMYTGIVGVVITVLLFRGLWRKIQYIRFLTFAEVETLLLIACIVSVVHSTTHNTGFFTLEPATLIVFGLLWGTTTKDSHPRFSKLFKRRIRF